jgi:hypothetical protein
MLQIMARLHNHTIYTGSRRVTSRVSMRIITHGFARGISFVASLSFTPTGTAEEELLYRQRRIFQAIRLSSSIVIAPHVCSKEHGRRTPSHDGKNQKTGTKIQGVSKRSLQWYPKCYCVASVTKTFAFKGVQVIRRSTPSTMSKRFHNARHTVTFGIPL